jgi:lysosomal acid lipase/cholesteryl ester hydrolase
MSRKFPNLRGVYQVPFAKFNHLDFVWAKNARKLLYDLVIEKLEQD